MEEYIGGKIFENIIVDERVTPDLNHCIYCIVTSSRKPNGIKSTDYKIPLDCIDGAMMKQCPACKAIYILKDKL